jgi:uncharacterized pyridoxal phosphate-containing UPF0001 family protein
VVDEQARRDELAANLGIVRDRIERACRAVGRDPGEVTLGVVTKTYPSEDVLRLAELGVTDVGENRDQEASPKAAAVAAAGVRVRWHFIGQLQRNKARSVVRYASVVQSVDSVRLAQALREAAARDPADGGARAPREVLVQVSLDSAAGRGGAVVDRAGRAGGGPADSLDPDTALDAVLAAVAESDSLRLGGLMAVAPLGQDPDPAFARLAALAEAVRRRYPSATVLSAGMSDDFELAIRHGATHVRVGSAVLGQRPPLG